MGAIEARRQPRALRRRWQELCDAWDEESEREGSMVLSISALRYLFFGQRGKP